MRKSSALIASATGIGALLAGATAYAAFNAATSVSTTHQAATMTALTVVSTDTDYEGDQTALWPGHPADVLITVANAGRRRCLEIERNAQQARLERLLADRTADLGDALARLDEPPAE